MSVSKLVALVLITGFTIGCAPQETTVADENGDGLPILDKAIEFHGGALYEHSVTSLTISSLSGAFDIVARIDGGVFDYTVTGKVGTDPQIERRVRLTNTTVQRWDDGVEVELDEQTAQRARNFVNARVFFPFLPHSLAGADTLQEDLGLETWNGRSLQKVKVTFRGGTSTDAEDSYMFWFDPESGRVEQFGYDFAGGLRFRQATEFTRVGGMLFSDQENYAIDGERIPVDALTPEYVAENMELLSVVKISNVSVEPLGS